MRAAAQAQAAALAIGTPVPNDGRTHLSIPKGEVSPLPTVAWEGEAVVVDTPEAALKAVEELYKADAVGFDTETRPSFRKGEFNKVALMQVATDERCYLFRLNEMGIPECLTRFLEDDKVVKVGLSIRDDFAMLRRRVETLEPRAFIELQSMVRQWGILDASLQRIYAIVFGARISKGQRLSNWEAPTLSAAQQAYASIDAWACLKLWRHLERGGFNPEESPWKVEPPTLPDEAAAALPDDDC